MDWIVPTYHPMFVGRGNERYRGLVEHDLGRVASILKGKTPRWNDKGYILRPTLEDIRAFVAASRGKRVAVDIEGDGRHPLLCDIRCIGMWNGQKGIAIPLLHRDGSTERVQVGKQFRNVRQWVPFYDWSSQHSVIGFLKDILTDKSITLNWQNGQFDRLAIKSKLKIVCQTVNYRDTIIDHHIVASYLPHDLGTLTSLYTDLWQYKSTEKGAGWSSETDEELWVYCIRDARTCFIAAPQIQVEIENRPEDIVLSEHDHWAERCCQDWKETGVWIDQPILRAFQTQYDRATARALQEMRGIVGVKLAEKVADLTEEMFKQVDEDTGEHVFRPSSLRELRAVLQSLKIPLYETTDSGEISTARDLLLDAMAAMTASGIPPTDPRIAFLNWLFAFREAKKTRSTFLEPYIHADGRIHPTFSVHVTPTGRQSSKNPNFQNQPKRIRAIYAAAPGKTLVFGDWDSLELRLAGLMSGEPALLKGFADFDAGTGPKIHKVNCCSIFGITLDQITDAMYKAAKTVTYGVLYGAGPNTAYTQAQKEMPELSMEKFQRIYEGWKKRWPTFFGWQRGLLAFVAKHHYWDSHILKRRRYFFERMDDDSPEAAAALNMPNQSTAYDVVSLANRRILELVKSKKYRGRVVQLGQIHDELLFECDDNVAEAFAKDFKRVAEQMVVDGWYLPVDMKVAKAWAKASLCRGAPKVVDGACKTCKQKVKEGEQHLAQN